MMLSDEQQITIGHLLDGQRALTGPTKGHRAGPHTVRLERTKDDTVILHYRMTLHTGQYLRRHEPLHYWLTLGTGHGYLRRHEIDRSGRHRIIVGKQEMKSKLLPWRYRKIRRGQWTALTGDNNEQGWYPAPCEKAPAQTAARSVEAQPSVAAAGNVTPA
jgi:hypothetical protein